LALFFSKTKAKRKSVGGHLIISLFLVTKTCL